MIFILSYVTNFQISLESAKNNVHVFENWNPYVGAMALRTEPCNNKSLKKLVVHLPEFYVRILWCKQELSTYCQISMLAD